MGRLLELINKALEKANCIKKPPGLNDICLNKLRSMFLLGMHWTLILLAISLTYPRLDHPIALTGLFFFQREEECLQNISSFPKIQVGFPKLMREVWDDHSFRS